MSNATITLAGREIPVRELNFAQLKRLLPAINRVARAISLDCINEGAMDDVGVVLCAATGMSSAQLDALPVKGGEIAPAFAAIVNLAGLGPKEETPLGEAQAVATPGTGTNSTPTLPPASDGHGEISTS